MHNDRFNTQEEADAYITKNGLFNRVVEQTPDGKFIVVFPVKAQLRVPGGLVR